MTNDPTREEMLAKLSNIFPPDVFEGAEFYSESAVYWFCSDYHSGQWSDLYPALSTSPYTPSRLAKGIESESELSQEMYAVLVREYTASDKT